MICCQGISFIAVTLLNCIEHPFFVDITDVHQEHEDFFDGVFAKEEDIQRV